MYYRMRITKTAKKKGSKESMSTFDNETKDFQTLKGLKEYLKDTYGKCKKQKMYVDTKQGETKHIGYIYCFITTYYPDYKSKYVQNDWVDISGVEENTILV